jgi:hypothetical protein
MFGMHIARIHLEKNKTEVSAMLMLWIVIGCMFLTGIGVRFTYRVLGLKPAEAVAIYVLIVMLVGVNTAPARQLISALF